MSNLVRERDPIVATRTVTDDSCFAAKLSFGSFSLHREHSIAASPAEREREKPRLPKVLTCPLSNHAGSRNRGGGVTDRIWYLFLLDLIFFACTLRVSSRRAKTASSDALRS